MTDRSPRDIIVVMTDQHRADLSAREGFPVDCTPTLDRLAADGRWFDRAYTSTPLCVPARISMLTGRFPSAHGVRGNSGYDNPTRSADLIDVLQAACYRTALVGKNHSHLTPDRMDHWVEYGHYGRIPAGAGNEFDAWLRANPGTTMTATPYPVDHQIPVRLVDEAITWLDAAGQDERSFLWLSIPEPHVPYQLPEPYFSAYTPETVPSATSDAGSFSGRDLGWRYAGRLAELSGEADPDVLARARANYVGMLRLIDDQLARLVDHLDDRLDDTLLVFLSDHGDFAGEYGLMRKGPGLPEVLTRIPMVWHGAGVSPDSAPSAAHVSLVDVLPTICDLVGAAIPPGVQGRSLVPLLSGDDSAAAEFASVYAEQGHGSPYEEKDLDSETPGVRSGANGQLLIDTVNEVTQRGVRRMIRAGRWKLLSDSIGRQLFDLSADPFELNDLSNEPGLQDVVEQLTADLALWLSRPSSTAPEPADTTVSSCCAAPRSRLSSAAPPVADISRSSAGTGAVQQPVPLPGGEFRMGDPFDEGYAGDGETPVHAVRLPPFAVDPTAVTNAEFTAFVEDSGYVTEAERYRSSAVFHLAQDASPEDVLGPVAGSPWWIAVRDACWRRPEGPLSGIDDRLDHPVVHVAHTDALAFCQWAGKRLLTEAEWEYAARASHDGRRFSWGDELTPDGVHRCNIWQGTFPTVNTLEDGYLTTAPVRSFEPNDFGLWNMSGNVWEWCADWFSPYYYRRSPVEGPTGPRYGEKRVMRGGSYLCHDSYCHRYRVAARSGNTPDSSSANLGFRCASDL